jgi:hypothetical protein
MRALLFLIAFSLFPIISHSQDSAFFAGNKAYAEKNYKEAILNYAKLIGADQMSANLYFNIGNAYYQTNQLSHAIWAYERALKIKPNHADAKFNLDFANQQVVDEIDREESAIGRWFKTQLLSFGINFWSVVSIIIAFALALFLFFYFTTKKQQVKGFSLSASFVGVFLLIISITFAQIQRNNLVTIDSGIISADVVIVKTSPNENASDAYELHEGSKVAILRKEGNWMEIDVNQNVGWISSKDILEI